MYVRRLEMEEPKKLKATNTEQETPIIVNEAMIPVINPEVTFREEMEEDGKYILFNAENELILVTNNTGKFILDICNGELTIGQIIKELENNFSMKDNTDLFPIIVGYLETLTQAKLITIKNHKLEQIQWQKN
jgi:hypothetical protein